jgi:hypothetical protein
VAQAQCACSAEEDAFPTNELPDFYSQLDVPSVPIIPLTEANAALPPPCATRVHLFDILPPDVVADLRRDGVRMIGPLPPPDVRPAMGVAPGEYHGIIMKAVAAGVCELRATPAESIQGLFGVFKSEELARVILDCRLANLLCRTPPNPRLPLIEVLRMLGVAPGSKLYCAILDLANYYHSIIMPEEWRDMFGLPPVVVDGVAVHPRWVTLPMGFSFSVYLAQLAHVHQLELKSAAFREAHRLVGALVPRLIGEGEVASEPYIDDLPCFSTAPGVANAALREMLAAEVVEAKDEKVQFAEEGRATACWGQENDAEGCIRPIPGKLLTLKRLTRAAVRSERLPTRALQRIVGRWLWHALLHRPLLSCFSPLFRQARSTHASVRLWPSSVRALLDLVALSPLLVVDPARPVGQLCATDASDYGGGGGA